MTGNFAPQIGERIGGRYKLASFVRGDGVSQVYLAHDGSQEVVVVLFDPSRCTKESWAAFAALVESAARAAVDGLSLLRGVTATPPAPPHCLAESQSGRGLDRLRAEDGPLPWRRALALGEQFAATLAAVDAVTGVAHRALIPARCIVMSEQETRILDYGVAEFEPMDGRADDLAYRAPEQQRGRGDRRSDVYSLAAILFELVAGQRPSVKIPPRLRSIVPDVPPAVDELFARALARDPGRRHADAAALRAALRELLGLGPVPAPVRGELSHAPVSLPGEPTPPPSPSSFTSPTPSAGLVSPWVPVPASQRPLVDIRPAEAPPHGFSKSTLESPARPASEPPHDKTMALPPPRASPALRFAPASAPADDPPTEQFRSPFASVQARRDDPPTERVVRPFARASGGSDDDRTEIMVRRPMPTGKGERTETMVDRTEILPRSGSAARGDDATLQLPADQEFRREHSLAPADITAVVTTSGDRGSVQSPAPVMLAAQPPPVQKPANPSLKQGLLIANIVLALTLLLAAIMM